MPDSRSAAKGRADRRIVPSAAGRPRPCARLRPASLAEAYAIRRRFQEIEEGDSRGAIAGYKIGLTTRSLQRLCGVAEPCYGAIFQSARCMTEEQSSAAAITAGLVSRPRSYSVSRRLDA